MNITEDVYRVLGYCPEQQRVRPGLLASATMSQIENALAHLLIEKGFDSAEALSVCGLFVNLGVLMQYISHLYY